MNLHETNYFTKGFNGWTPPLPPEMIETDLLRETIYDTLHHRLVTGRILPGVGISTRGVARELGVSQMPVREAMTRLAAEGVVDIRSRRHVMVRMMTVSLLDDIRGCRILFESEAVKRATKHINKAAILALEKQLATLVSASKTEDSVAVLEAKYDFHFTLFNAAHSPILLPMIDSLWLRFVPYLRAAFAQFGVQPQIDLCQKIIDALQAQDDDQLQNYLVEEINATMAWVGKPVLPHG